MPNVPYNKAAAEIAREHLARQRQYVPEGPLPDISTDEGLLARGYLTPDGLATPEGDEFLALHEAGVFDNKGQLSLKGEAFVMDPEDVIADDQKLPHYMVLRQEGMLDTPDTSVGELVGQLGEIAYDFGAGVLNELGAGARPDEKKQAELEIQRSAWLTSALKQSANLGAGIAQIVATGVEIDGKQVSPAMFDKEEDALQYYAAEQKIAKTKLEIRDATKAEIVGGLMGSLEVINEIESQEAANRKLVGEEVAATAQKRGEAIGTFIEPTAIASMGTGFFVSKAAQGPTLAARLSSKVTTAQAASAAAEFAAVQAKAGANNVAKLTEIATNAAKQSDDLAMIGDVPAAIAARTTAETAAAQAQRATAASATLQAEAAQKAALAERLVKQAGGAERALDALTAVQQAKAIPANVVAAAADKVGDFLIRSDELLQEGLAKMGMDEARQFATKVGIASAGVMFPGVASIGTALAAGPLIKNIGNLARMVGKEQLAARGSLPFWRRVSQNSAATPFTRGMGRFLDSATLGGKAMAPVRLGAQTAKGVAAAIPMDIGFEVLGDGGKITPNTIRQGVAESLVFAGTGAAMGSLVSAPLRAKQQQQMGDVMNFRAEKLDDSTRPIFDRMAKGSQRTLATYAATNPSLEIRITEEGSNFYDRAKNTATVNVKSPGWIRPLVAHEVMHHVIVKGQMKEGISAWLVGTRDSAETPTTGGLLRSKDGKLDPTFEAAMNAYNQRMEQEGKIPLSVEDFAEEYFIETATDDFVGMAESGELSKLAARSPLERMMRETASILIPKVPLIRDLAIKLGGAYDKGGKMVQGNGLLADGVRELPGAKAMLRRMVRVSAGEADIKPKESRERKGVDEEKGPGIPMEMLRNNPALVETNFAVFQHNPDNTAKLDKDGYPIFITKEQDIQRQLGGLAVAEYYREKVKQGNLMPGELSPQPDGSWQGTWMDNKAIDELARSGVYDQRSIRHLRLMNAAAKNPQGQSFIGVNHPATIPRPGKRKAYGTLGATFREFGINGIRIGSKGQVLIALMSFTQLMQNIETRANSARGKKLYNGNQLEILKDVEAVGDLHRQNLATDDYFKQKYGPQWEERKKFINTCFGLMTKEQQSINPMFVEDNVNNGNVFKTYRLDRMSQVTQVQGGIRMPVGYETIKANFFPNGLPEGDIRGVDEVSSFVTPEMDAEYMRAVESGDTQSAGFLLRRAAKLEGAYPGTWFHGSPFESRIKVFDPTKGKSFGGWNAIGNWLTLDRKAAEGWAKNYRVENGKLIPSSGTVYPLFAFLKKPLALDGYESLTDLWREITQKETNDSTPADVKTFREEVRNRGYDSLLISNVEGDSPEGANASQTYVIAFDPTQIKSADPVTYDDAGNIIPLSERFGNPKTK